MMEILQEILSTLLIILGVIFMMVAALGILRLPDFYIRMSAITKAGTMGVGLIVVGIAVYFNELLISAKAFVIISFMILTAPVAAHIIARAAYRQGVPFWGRNLVDELGDIVKGRDRCEEIIAREPDNLQAKLEILNYHTILPPVLGGSLRKAFLTANEIKELDNAEGHRAFGMIYSKKNDYHQAEKEYMSAIEASGGLIRYKYDLGRFYREIQWYDKAFRIFEGISKQEPGQLASLLEIGKTAALSGLNSERGEEALNNYLNARLPGDKQNLAKASFYMGLIFLNRKEYIMAREYFEKSLYYDPDFPDASSYLGQVSKR
jgi:multicomponent Na+:H+ antiporter subunit G